MANGWRALGLFRRLDLLLSLGAQPDPRLRLLLALVWAVVFMLFALAVWRRMAAARGLLVAALLAYALYELAVSVLLARSEVARQGWPALVVLSALAVVAVAWALNHRAARLYFGVEEEYVRSQD